MEEESIYETIVNEAGIQVIIDTETGEVVSMMATTDDIDKDAVVNWAADKLAEVQSLQERAKAHKDYLTNQIQSYERSQKRIKSWLANMLGGQKHDTGIHKVGRFRHWENMVDITDSKQIPDEMKKDYVSRVVDKEAVKSLLLKGEDVPGAKLVDYWSCSFDGGKKNG